MHRNHGRPDCFFASPFAMTPQETRSSRKPIRPSAALHAGMAGRLHTESPGNDTTATHLSTSRRVRANTAIVLIAASALGACSADRSPAEAKTAAPVHQDVPVVVAEVVRKTAPAWRAAGVGNVEAPTSVALKSRVDGQIVKVGFRDGADVREGQMLFEIDPRPAIALQLKQAQAKLEARPGPAQTRPGTGDPLQGPTEKEVRFPRRLRAVQDQPG